MIKKSAVVPYHAEQMYDLVNDIESYPEFLPWCSEARVLEHGENRLKALVSMASGSIRQSFSTENTMEPGRRIDVHLLSGPFKYLDGYWLFEPLEDERCRISLEMHFEFKNKILKLTLDKVFRRIVDSLVGAFSERARQVYGSA
ncbi:MAG: type II toxin-antitoxin system RatA family toxin [Gammaproteobacteria bacterium]